MSYCVVRSEGQWKLALLAGRRKDVLPETFRRVRDACREAMRLNAVYEATRATESHEALQEAV